MRTGTLGRNYRNISSRFLTPLHLYYSSGEIITIMKPDEILYEDGDIVITSSDVDEVISKLEDELPLLAEMLNAEVDSDMG